MVMMVSTVMVVAVEAVVNAVVVAAVVVIVVAVAVAVVVVLVDGGRVHCPHLEFFRTETVKLTISVF